MQTLCTVISLNTEVMISAFSCLMKVVSDKPKKFHMV